MKILVKLITIIQAIIVSYYTLNFQFGIIENLVNFTYPTILSLLIDCSMLWIVLIANWILTAEILAR